MDKLEKDVLVVDRNALFDAEKDKFQGFKPHSNIDFQSRILKGFKYIKRRIAEQDESHKQPIGYALIMNPKTKKVYIRLHPRGSSACKVSKIICVICEICGFNQTII